MHLALRKAPRTEGTKSAPAPMIQQRFCEDAPRGITSAQKQHIMRTIGHRSRRLRGFAAGLASIQSDRRLAIRCALARRQECLPLNTLRIRDPALFTLRV